MPAKLQALMEKLYRNLCHCEFAWGKEHGYTVALVVTSCKVPPPQGGLFTCLSLWRSQTELEPFHSPISCRDSGCCPCSLLISLSRCGKRTDLSPSLLTAPTPTRWRQDGIQWCSAKLQGLPDSHNEGALHIPELCAAIA